MKSIQNLAFPVQYIDKDQHGFEKLFIHTGLTAREYFAARAMQGLISNPTAANNAKSGEAFRKVVAEAAVGLADALIDALKQEVQP